MMFFWTRNVDFNTCIRWHLSTKFIFIFLMDTNQYLCYHLRRRFCLLIRQTTIEHIYLIDPRSFHDFFYKLYVALIV